MARAQGYGALYLNSVPEIMAVAYRLYLQLGFTPAAAYKHVPIPGIRFLRLGLDEHARQAGRCNGGGEA